MIGLPRLPRTSSGGAKQALLREVPFASSIAWWLFDCPALYAAGPEIAEPLSFAMDVVRDINLAPRCVSDGASQLSSEYTPREHERGH
jgi:hypothetical protein